jgi:hypothetical protein
MKALAGEHRPRVARELLLLIEAQQPAVAAVQRQSARRDQGRRAAPELDDRGGARGGNMIGDQDEQTRVGPPAAELGQGIVGKPCLCE